MPRGPRCESLWGCAAKRRPGWDAAGRAFEAGERGRGGHAGAAGATAGDVYARGEKTWGVAYRLGPCRRLAHPGKRVFGSSMTAEWLEVQACPDGSSEAGGWAPRRG